MNAQAQDTVETPVSAALLTALRNHAQAVIASGKLKGKQGQRWALKAQQTWEALKALGVTDDIGLALSPAQEQAADSILTPNTTAGKPLLPKPKPGCVAKLKLHQLRAF